MIANIVKGSGFRGALDYVLGKKDAVLLHTTLGSKNARGMAAELAAYRNLRPALGKAVFHCSLAVGEDDSLSPEQWHSIAEKYLAGMGFGDAPWTLVRHQDADHDHVHIIASRIRPDGSVVSDSRDFERTEKLLRGIEKEYELTAVANSKDVKVRAVTIAELEKADRKGAPPPRLLLQEIVSRVADESENFKDFALKLDAAGVDFKPTLQMDNTKWSGAAFRLRDDDDGIWFGGGKLASSLKVGALIKRRGIEYVKDRDLETASICIERAALDADRSAGRDSSSTERLNGNDQAGAAGRAEIAAGAERFSAETISKEDAGGTGGTGERKGVELSMATGGSGGIRSSGNGTADEITRIAAEAPGPKPEHIKIKEAAWAEQHAALRAERYRITLMPRRDGDPVIIPGNDYGRRKGVDEIFYTADEVRQQFRFLSLKNAGSYEVYITPIDPNHHYLVVDDLTPTTKDELLNAGYEPCLIQESSQDNLQAIIKAPKPEISKQEQSTANEFVQGVNKKYGDKAFTGAIHPFRLAGFANKKIGKNSPFTKIIQAIDRVCGKAVKLLEMIRSRRKKAELERQQERMQAAKVQLRGEPAALMPSSKDGSDLVQTLERYRLLMKTSDESRRDFGACVAMLRAGFSAGEVENALLLHPATRRKHDPANYAGRTTDAALEAYRNIRDSQARKESDRQNEAQKDSRARKESDRHSEAQKDSSSPEM